MFNCLGIVVCLAVSVVLFNPAVVGLRITCSVLQSLKMYPNDSSFLNEFNNISAIDPIVLGNVASEGLILNNNIFEYLPGDLFDFNVNFTSVSFAQNRITKIHPRTFSKLKELNSIYLNENQLVEIDASLFRTNKKLEIINLDNNKIKFFHPNTFEGLTGLIFLYVQENQLRSFDSNLLKPLRRLEGFFLRKNNLTEINYSNLKEVIPLLSSLSLGDNYFNCSFAKPMDDYLLRNEIENKIYHDSSHANISCVSDEAYVEMARYPFRENEIESTTVPEEKTNDVLNSTGSIDPREEKCNITFETPPTPINPISIDYDAVVESIGSKFIEKIFLTFESIKERFREQENLIKLLQLQLAKQYSALNDLQMKARSRELQERLGKVKIIFYLNEGIVINYHFFHFSRSNKSMISAWLKQRTKYVYF